MHIEVVFFLKCTPHLTRDNLLEYVNQPSKPVPIRPPIHDNDDRIWMIVSDIVFGFPVLIYLPSTI